MTVKQHVLDTIREHGKGGITVSEYLNLEMIPSRVSQTVYPCFTQLCKDGKILDSQLRRKSPKGRRSIVWVDKKHGGVMPVWGSGYPSYSYKGRTKLVMDLLEDYGPLSVTEMCSACKKLDQMSLSSLLSRLRSQKWIRSLATKRKNSAGQSCLVFELTPRGRQVRGVSPRRNTRRKDVTTPVRSAPLEKV
jgi:DNA-binding PadR family transcriptional regulator